MWNIRRVYRGKSIVRPRSFRLQWAAVLVLPLSLGCRSTSPVRVAASPPGGEQTSASRVDLPAVGPRPADHCRPSDWATLAQHREATAADNATPLSLPETVAAPEFETPRPPIRQPVEYFVSLAAANHPRIRAAQARVSAAANRVPQVSALEDPLLSNNFYPVSDQALQTAAGRAGNTLSISQKYPWPKKRSVRAQVACREVQIARAQLAQVELEVEEAARLAYYELWFADRAIEINEQSRDIAVEIVELAEARNAAGGSQRDVLRAQLQLDAIDNQLIGLHRQKAVAQADLAALIQLPDLVGIEPVENLDTAATPARLDALFAAAEQCSPRLREYRWAVSRDRQQQRLACLARRPDFTLGAGWQTITESDAVSPVADGSDNVSFAVGVTLPIWRARIDAAIREASCEAAASARELQAARDDAFRELRRLTDQAYAADEQLRLYNERILPRAKRALQLASADYRGQRVDFGEVADGFQEILTFNLQAARAEATLAGLVAQIDRAVGCEVQLGN